MYTYNLGLAFDRVAAEFKNKPAIILPDEDNLSFAELNSASNRFAHLLLKYNFGKGDVVCIAGEKTRGTFAAMLGCLKVGVAYSILDPESPLQRLERILENCRPSLILANSLVDEQVRQLKTFLSVPILNLEWSKFAESIATHSEELPDVCRRVTGENPAYIMYTSGSTGFPKGALMTHANVLNFIAWGREEFQLRTEDVFTNVNPLYFDNSVFDFYVSIFNGASLVPFSRKHLANPSELVALVDRHQCTSWFSVPSMLIYLMSTKSLTANSFSCLKRIIFGGEGYPKAKLKQLYELFAPRISFFNVYGPTEATCICSAYIIGDSDFDDLAGFPPLGQIVDNFDYLIVDESLQVVEKGQSGELCLLGPNVGKGYFRDFDRTRGSFVQNPVNKDYQELMYRTGDLVRFDVEQEKIEILGRVDNQIKHMGYRIELEEIENGLCRLPYVNQAAVVHGERRGLSQIVAVVHVQQEVEVSKVRQDLKDILPSYMIPTDFRFVHSELQKNKNGKVDRRAISSEIWGQQRG